NSVMFAVSLLALAFIRHVWLLNAFLFLTGFAWIAVLSTLNMGAQRSAAKWVKARALAVYLTFFFGAMTAGSALWGQLASHFSIATALCVATVGLLLASLTARRWKLNKDPDLNLDIRDIDSRAQALDISHERGPVMVMYEYQIDPEDVYDFVVCVQEIRRVRQRGGALSWSVYEDIQRPGVFVESFVVGTWIEHLRQQERHTVNDLLIQSRVQAFHRGGQLPLARYFIAPVM
ncbi:MFS transporter, partial [Cronobacter dublinensis subsp. dublinensis]|nr:MFS transporter [Cronobacter dublinensis subsp. dublinensis]